MWTNVLKCSYLTKKGRKHECGFLIICFTLLFPWKHWASPGQIEVPQWFLWFDPPGREVVQADGHIGDAHGCVDGRRLCDPATVGVYHHQSQRL